MKLIVQLFILLSIISCKNKDDSYNGTSTYLTLADLTPTEIIGDCPESTVFPDWVNSPYILPFGVGQSFPIGLSSCSGSYHSEGQPDHFAIDFNMPIGTPVMLSRPGRVIYIVESGEDYYFPNNFVVIDHGDGTYGQYMHLTKNGATVSVGQNLGLGSTIGISGATGLAGYPHLHFVVTQAGWDYPYISVPLTFSNTTPNPNGLVENETYYALLY